MNTDNNKQKCCICGNVFWGWGNNPWPIKEYGKCCDACNASRVLPARIARLLLSTTNK